MPKILTPATDPSAAEIIDDLINLGWRRDQWREGRNLTAAAERARIAQEIRKAHREARDIGLSQLDIADALGISRAQLHTITRSNPANGPEYHCAGCRCPGQNTHADPLDD